MSKIEELLKRQQAAVLANDGEALTAINAELRLARGRENLFSKSAPAAYHDGPGRVQREQQTAPSPAKKLSAEEQALIAAHRSEARACTASGQTDFGMRHAAAIRAIEGR